jgi:hypothetical protein
VDSDAGVAGRTGAIALPPGVTDLTWDAGISKSPQVLPQVITTTPPETLPFTGALGGGLSQVGVALVVFGGLVVLALSRREEEVAPAVLGSSISRSGYRGKHRQ